MLKPATIKDIAKTLGVSISTVSRALRGQSDVSEETKKSVVALAEKLDYQPNRVALSLLSKHTYTIGVIVPNLDYFFATAIKGIDEVALEAGYTVMVCHSNEQYEREVVNIKRLQESRVDGFIVSVASNTQQFDHFKKLADRNVPVVYFDRDCPDILGSTVTLDNELGGFLATEHLIEQGCKQIVFLAGPERMSISNKRKQGYLSALKKYDIPIDESLIHYCDFNREHAYYTTLDILKKRKKPDGLFAVSDRIAIGAMLAIKDKGLSMPKDIAVVGFNNDPVTDLVTPGLTSVDQPAYKMGKIAAESFFDILKSEDEHYHPKEIILKPKLIIRGSSNRKFK